VNPSFYAVPIRTQEHAIELKMPDYQVPRGHRYAGLETAACRSRMAAWVKFKITKSQEFVIGGYTLPEGGRKYFGSLLVQFATVTVSLAVPKLP
jgi:hypothetical protein